MHGTSVKYLLGSIILFSAGLVTGTQVADRKDAGIDNQSTTEVSPNNITAMPTCSPTTAAPPLETILQQLAEKLDNEIVARKKLEEKFTRFEQQLANLSESSSLTMEANGLAVPNPTVTENTSLSTENLFAETEETRKLQALDVLLSLGLDTAQTEQLQQRAESIEMEQLFLRNEAIREGWMSTEKYFIESQQLQNSANTTREALGEQNYDLYLFKLGTPNRVFVQSVIANSPAEKAGLQAGDVIYRYGDDRIFNWSDLTTATTQGEASETVRLEAERAGERFEIYLPRGPLGIRLESKLIDPA